MARTKRDFDAVSTHELDVKNKFEIGGTQVTSTAAELNLLDGLTGPVDGYAAGYKLARGSQAATASAAINTGLTTIVGFSLAIDASAAANVNNSPALSGKASGATLTVYRWKHTSTSNPTLVAATTAGTIKWIAVGT